MTLQMKVHVPLDVEIKLFLTCDNAQFSMLHVCMCVCSFGKFMGHCQIMYTNLVPGRVFTMCTL